VLKEDASITASPIINFGFFIGFLFGCFGFGVCAFAESVLVGFCT